MCTCLWHGDHHLLHLPCRCCATFLDCVGSAVLYNAVHGAQLISITDTTVDIAFYAATNSINAYAALVDCHRIIKSEGRTVSYSSCMPSVNPTHSLLTRLAAGTAGSVDETCGGETGVAAAAALAAVARERQEQEDISGPATVAASLVAPGLST